MKNNFRKGNLVVLDYAQKGRYVNVVDAEEAEAGIKGLSIDTENSSWTFDGESHAIGIMRRCKSSHRFGVIGVYDRTKTSHLELMVFHAQKATE